MSSTPPQKSSVHHDEFTKERAETSFDGEDPDGALAVLRANANEEAITPEEVRKLVRKIDLVLMPLMMVTYGLNYIDKAVFSIAALFGMVADLQLFKIVSLSPLRLDTGRYSYASMIFYAGLLLGSPVFAYIGQRYNIARTIGFTVVVWGIVCICSAALQDYTGTMVQRFILGVVEAGVSPLFLLFTSMWYTKSEQALRIGIWYSGTGWGVLIGSPLAYAILHIKTRIHLWRVLYMFWGSITIVFGVALFIFLPSSPVNSRYLNKRERYVAIERLRADQSSVENKVFKREQAIEALTDIKVLLLSVISFLLMVANGAVSSFTPLVIQTILKSTNFETLLLIMPGGVCASVTQILLGYIASRTSGLRAYLTLFSISITLICSSLLWRLPLTNSQGLLASVYLMATFSAGFVLIMSFTASNVAGHTKKATAAAMVTVMSGLGNIAGPLFFQALDAPRYPKGFLATTVCYAIAFVLTVCYRICCVRENSKRDAMGASALEDHAFQDLTDGQNKSFRYTF